MKLSVEVMKMKSLKKMKYWQRNGGFTFQWPEVKITRLINMHI